MQTHTHRETNMQPFTNTQTTCTQARFFLAFFGTEAATFMQTHMQAQTLPLSLSVSLFFLPVELWWWRWRAVCIDCDCDTKLHPAQEPQRKNSASKTGPVSSLLLRHSQKNLWSEQKLKRCSFYAVDRNKVTNKPVNQMTQPTTKQKTGLLTLTISNFFWNVCCVDFTLGWGS